MMLKVWQFLTVMLMTLVVAAGLAHAMELEPKMDYDARLYVQLHRTLYRYYGATAGIAEFVVTVSLVALAWKLRGTRGVFGPIATSAGLMVFAHLLFFALVQPANATMSSWPLDGIPQDWTSWRDRWEYSHAVRAGLSSLAMALLVISIMRTPAAFSPQRETQRS